MSSAASTPDGDPINPTRPTGDDATSETSSMADTTSTSTDASDESEKSDESEEESSEEEEDWSWLQEDHGPSEESEPAAATEEEEKSDSTESTLYDSHMEDLTDPGATTAPLHSTHQSRNLPEEVKLMIFKEAARAFSTQTPTKLTYVWAHLHLGPASLEPTTGPTFLDTKVKIYHKPHVHAALQTLKHLCYDARQAMLGNEPVLFFPEMGALEVNRNLETEADRCASLPVLGGATRDIVMRNMYGAGMIPVLPLEVCLPIDGTMVCKEMLEIFGNKLERLYLLDEQFPSLQNCKRSIHVPETGRTYQFRMYNYHDGLEGSIRMMFPNLPFPTAIKLLRERAGLEASTFEDRDARVFDITSSDRDYKRKVKFYGKDMFPEHFAEIIRMYPDGSMTVNAGIKDEFRSEFGYPDIESEARLQQVVELVAGNFPGLEYVAVLGRLAPKPRRDAGSGGK